MTLPVYDVDLFADDVILDPYPHYRAMRDLGPMAWAIRDPMRRIWYPWFSTTNNSSPRGVTGLGVGDTGFEPVTSAV